MPAESAWPAADHTVTTWGEARMTLKTVDALTRRASLLTLGAGLAVVAPLLADAKQNTNKKRKKKLNKKAKQKCQQQVEQCEETTVAACEGDPQCIEDAAEILLCCEFLAACDFAGLIACVLEAQDPN
jgi:hypothetical protein